MKFNKKRLYPEIPAEAQGVLPSKELLELIPLELIREFRAFVFEKAEDSVSPTVNTLF